MAIDLEKALQKAKRERGLISDFEQQPPENLKFVSEPCISGPSYRNVQKVQLDDDILARHHCVCAMPTDRPESGYYKVLRAQIQQIAAQKDLKTIMLTSTTPDEGKTLTSINLAFSFSRAFDQTVLLIDADLKKQQIHKTLGIDSQYGLGDYLINNQPIKDCLIWPEGWKLVLVSGGGPVENSSELLSSQLMMRFIKEAGERYQDRLVFIDAPPIMSGADAISLAPLVDGVIVVIRSGQTSTKQVRKAIELLPKDKVVGLVLNGKKMGSGSARDYYEV